MYSLDKVNIPKVVREKINLKIESNGGESLIDRTRSRNRNKA